ncbi:MAG: pilin, partial [Patescibacteria group bacterium]|nr:pilin [Patescibacteria group bacterium]
MKNFYNIFKKYKKNIFCLSLIFSLFTIGFVFAQEVEYPQIKQGMETPSSFETFAKYVFNFIVVCSGLIALAALMWGGFKYLTSMGEPKRMEQGKKQILYGFLGVIILLGSYVILATINPQLTIFNLEKLKKVQIIPKTILSFEYPSEAIRSCQAPIGKLIDGIRIKGDATSTKREAVYGKADITEDDLKNYTSFNDELDGKLSALSQTEDDDKIESITKDIKGMRPRFRKSYSTKIEDVIAKKNAVNQACYDQFTGQKTASVSGLEDVAKSTNDFSNKYDNQAKQEAKNLVSNLKNKTTNLKNFSGNEIDIDSSALSNLENFKEKYNKDTENLTNEIENKVDNVKTTSYDDEIAKARVEKAINKLKETTKSFKEGYQIREDIWQTSEQSVKMSDELDKYREFSKWEDENENFKEVNFFYEGAVAKTKMKRILELDKQIKEKSEQIQALGLFMMTASKVLVVITPPCECLYCIKTCTLCVGDPCPTRPAIIAAQNVLGRGVMALPALSAQLQKYTDELKKERKLLQQSVKGLERVRKIVENCHGARNKDRCTPFSINEIQDYRDAYEELVGAYKIKTIDSWQEIEIKNDPFTMYCLKEPALRTKGSAGSPLGTQKVVCETEIKVGELIDETIEATNKIIKKIDETTDNSQDVVDEASRIVPSGPVRGIYGELLKKEKITKECSGKVTREVEDILKGKQIKELLIYIENSIPYKYDKDVIGKLMEKIPEKDLKKIISQAVKDTEGKKLKKNVVDYLSSLKNPEKKERTIWLFEAMSDKNLKYALLKSIDSIKGEDIKKIWENQLREMGKQGIGQLFGHIIKEFEKKHLKIIFTDIFDAFPENEDRTILKAMLKASSRLYDEIDEMLKDCDGEDIQEKVDNASDIKGKLKLTLDLLYKVKETLEIKEQFREALSNIQEENFERGIRKSSGNNLKKITKELILYTPDYEIKDMVNNDFVAFNNNFFQEIINSIPDKSLPKILASNILKPIPEKDLKKIIEQGCYPISEPGEAVVSLIGGSPST